MAEKTLTVTQKVKELIYDIQNKSYLTGQARDGEGEKGYQAVSNMQATDEEESGYQIRRSLTTAFASLKDVLGEYLNEEHTTSDNLIETQIDGDGELVLEFVLPGNFDSAAAQSLSENIHSYLVNSALVEWFTITDKDDVKSYLDFAEGNVKAIKRALYKRSRPQRPVYP